MTINTKQSPPIELTNKYKRQNAIQRQCVSVRGYTRLFMHIGRGALNHSSSMVVDLEVDVDVKVSLRGPAVFNLVVHLV